MKKILTLSLVTAALVTGAMAKSENKQNMITIGATMNDSTLVNDEGVGAVLGFKYRRISDSNIVFGTNFDFNYFSGKDSNNEDTANFDFGGDILLGYHFDSVKTSVYGLVGYDAQMLGTDQSLSNGETGSVGYGWDFGGGVDWEFATDWHAIAEYKVYNMSLEGIVDYDYQRAQVTIGYDFE